MEGQQEVKTQRYTRSLLSALAIGLVLIGLVLCAALIVHERHTQVTRYEIDLHSDRFDIQQQIDALVTRYEIDLHSDIQQQIDAQSNLPRRR